MAFDSKAGFDPAELKRKALEKLKDKKPKDKPTNG